jgi:hypothetical protein
MIIIVGKRGDSSSRTGKRVTMCTVKNRPDDGGNRSNGVLDFLKQGFLHAASILQVD